MHETWRTEEITKLPLAANHDRNARHTGGRNQREIRIKIESVCNCDVRRPAGAGLIAARACNDCNAVEVAAERKLGHFVEAVEKIAALSRCIQCRGRNGFASRAPASAANWRSLPPVSKLLLIRKRLEGAALQCTVEIGTPSSTGPVIRSLEVKGNAIRLFGSESSILNLLKEVSLPEFEHHQPPDFGNSRWSGRGRKRPVTGGRLAR